MGSPSSSSLTAPLPPALVARVEAWRGPSSTSQALPWPPKQATHTLPVTELASHLSQLPSLRVASPVTRVLATSCSVPARATCSLHSCNSQCPLPLRLTSTRSRRTSLVSFHQAAVPALTMVSLQLDTELRMARTTGS